MVYAQVQYYLINSLKKYKIDNKDKQIYKKWIN